MNNECTGCTRNSFWNSIGGGPQITANASQIPGQLDDDMSAMLPVVQTDIMLTHGEKTLIDYAMRIGKPVYYLEEAE